MHGLLQIKRADRDNNSQVLLQRALQHTKLPGGHIEFIESGGVVLS